MLAAPSKSLRLRADEMGCDVWDLLQPARVKGEVDEGGRSVWLMSEARLSNSIGYTVGLVVVVVRYMEAFLEAPRKSRFKRRRETHPAKALSNSR